MIYAFIVDRCADLRVEVCCRTMKVSRSAFYAWRHHQANPAGRILADAELGDLVVNIHEQSLGLPPIWLTSQLRGLVLA